MILLAFSFASPMTGIGNMILAWPRGWSPSSIAIHTPVSNPWLFYLSLLVGCVGSVNPLVSWLHLEWTRILNSELGELAVVETAKVATTSVTI